MLKIQKYVINNIVNAEIKTLKVKQDLLTNDKKFVAIPSLESLKNISTNNLQINNVHLLSCIDKPEIKELNNNVYTLYINTNLFDNYTYKIKNIDKSNTITTRIMLSYVYFCGFFRNSPQISAKLCKTYVLIDRVSANLRKLLRKMRPNN